MDYDAIAREVIDGLAARTQGPAPQVASVVVEGYGPTVTVYLTPPVSPQVANICAALIRKKIMDRSAQKASSVAVVVSSR